MVLNIIFLFGCQPKKSSQGQNFLSKVDQMDMKDDSDELGFFENKRTPIEPAMQLLPSGNNRPEGWIFTIMKNDLVTGMVGALDDLYPGFEADDIFNSNRRGALDDVPEMGDLKLTGEPWEKSIMWWNAETLGNWWDGFIRHAYLINDQDAVNQSVEIIKNLLASQDEDGYIGIYKKNLRYKHEGANGELWAQTTAFRTMIGYYEITKDTKVLEAVERGMALTMKNYNDGIRNPFLLKDDFGGVTHGLMLTDVCEALFRITGKQEYQDYGTYLYKAFSTYSINRAFNDLRYPYLTKRDSLFISHGVHTYEQFRTLINAYYNTGYPELKEAYENALYKLGPTILPSGAGHGNEWIAGLIADPDKTATEFCTMLELRNSLGAIMQKTGDVSFADQLEKLTFNGMMGFRNREGTALAYSKHDNCYILDGQEYGSENVHKEVRYKYSPTHQEPAVCCAPNYARNHPYYLDMMWMKKKNGLAAVLFGPSTLRTQINDIPIEISQRTGYPFSDTIEFVINPKEEIKFPLFIRKPQWANSISIIGGDAEPILTNGFYEISKLWKKGDVVKVTFELDVELKSASNHETYFQRGPLVFAYEIPSQKQIIKNYDLSEFSDYHVIPTDMKYKDLKLVTRESATSPMFSYFNKTISDSKNPWNDLANYLEIEMINATTGKKEKVRLIPMGGTILRRITFPVHK